MQIGRGGHPDGADTVDALLATIREILDDDRRVVDVDADLEADLGFDSLSVAELLVRAEELFGVPLPDDTLATVGTPADLLAAAGLATATRPRSGDAAPPSGSGSPGTDVAAFEPRPPRPTGTLRRVIGSVHGLWALTAFAVVAAVFGPLTVLAPTLRTRWRLVRGAGRLLAALAGVRVRVEGARHLPHARPFVMVANHASHLDPLVLVRLLEEPAVFVALAVLADHPLLRLGLGRLRAHLVGRGDRVRGVADAEALTDAVRGGHTVVFFPEGRRTPRRGLEPFRMGAFLVAARSGVPVVPVAVRGTRAVLPVGRLLPRRGTVTLTVGSPLVPPRADWQSAVELRRRARHHILRHVDEPDLA